MSNLSSDLFVNGVYKHIFAYLGSFVYDLALVSVIFVVLGWFLRSVLLGVLNQRLKGAYAALNGEVKEKSNTKVFYLIGLVCVALVGYYFGYYMNLSSLGSNFGNLVVIDNILTAYRFAGWLLIICLVGIYTVLIYSAYGHQKRKKEISEKVQRSYVLFGKALAIFSYLVVILVYVTAFWLIYGTFK